MKLTLGFSPCPNDTFIFDSLVNKKIDTEGLEFDVMLEDVETLNQWSLQSKLDITKISYGVLPLVLIDYIVLNSGGALGRGTGPLLVAKQEITDLASEIPNRLVALPGLHTTAHMLFSLAFPQARNRKFMIFSGIEDAVVNGNVDCGVIIHENRFTYQEKGLIKLMDLGESWEENTKLPIPLGGIVARRELGLPIQQKVDRLIRKSIESSFSTYPLLSAYVRDNAQEMDEKVMRQHIDLYVNHFTLDLESQGRAAVWKLLEMSTSFIPEPQAGSYQVFVDKPKI
jgi:1,4-dihydroxy-6-naphthoate synthase